MPIDWTEAQLADFVRREIEKREINQLPQLPSKKPNEVEPRHDDLLIFKGDKWVPYTMPAVRVWRSTPLNVGAGAAIAVTFNTERFDTERQAPGMWEGVGFSNRLTAYQPGVYLVVARLRFNIQASGLKAWIRKTDAAGTQTIVDEEAPHTHAGFTGGETELHWALLVTLIQLAKNEYVEVLVGHDALATVTVESEADKTPIFSMTRIA